MEKDPVAEGLRLVPVDHLATYFRIGIAEGVQRSACLRRVQHQVTTAASLKR